MLSGGSSASCGGDESREDSRDSRSRGFSCCAVSRCRPLQLCPRLSPSAAAPFVLRVAAAAAAAPLPPPLLLPPLLSLAVSATFCLAVRRSGTTL